MKNKYTFEDIEAYLAGEQPGKERQSFETALAEDEALQEAVDKHRLSHRLTSAYAAERTRSRVAAVFAAQQKQQPVKVFSLGRWAAAAAILFLLAGGYWVIGTQQQSGASLAETYLEPYPDRITTMGSEADALTQAMAAYNQGRYEEALASFAELPEGAVSAELLNLYIGTSALETGQFTQAERTLQRTARSATDYAAAGKWYLALTYLKQEKVAQARPLLEELRSEGTYKRESATQLLETLP